MSGRESFLLIKIANSGKFLVTEYRLDELLKRSESALKSEAVKIGNANSLTGSNQSSHSPSVTGESLDVKVEITPAPPTPASDIQTSYSIESTSSLTICSDASSKSQGTSPHARKFSEIPHESGSFLNPIGNFNRLNPSPPNTASARLFKKLEEMIDLSSPYNHYRCLSPSETNLSIPVNERSQVVSPNSLLFDSGGKPGSSRLLRRQFSLDKDDLTMQKHANLETISSMVESSKHSNLAVKTPYQPLISTCSLPGSSGTNVLTSKLHKHQSASVALDLEKIEEIPISPISTSPQSKVKDQNSFKNSSNSNNKVKTPPANLEESKEFNINIEMLG